MPITTVLTQKTHVSIIQFNEYGHIGFRYKNILLKFREEDFFEFQSALERIDFERESHVFEDDVPRVIINTFQSDTQFCFTKAEFKTIKQAIAEASLMLQVNEILSPG